MDDLSKTPQKPLRQTLTRHLTTSPRMFRRALTAAAPLRRRLSTAAAATSSSASSAVDSVILRSLKDHYLEVSKMSPPPKVTLPEPFAVVKGALDGDGPVLRREYKGEEIEISVMRLANILPAGAEDDDEDGDSINQLFLHVDVSKPGRVESLHFLCGLYPDAVGIHSVCLRPKCVSRLGHPELNKYRGQVFGVLDQKIRDGFYTYIEERGINGSLFKFLQAWLYVKDHRNLMHWFKSLGTFIKQA